MGRLETLRRASGKSRAQVAATFDISERHLYRLERGITPLSRFHAIAFSEFYEVDISELLDAGEPDDEVAA